MTSRGDAFEELHVPDMERRLAGLVRIGTVAELDEAKAMVKIKSGNILTDWLPWKTLRAGPDRSWAAIEVGEQVIMAAPGGDITQAVILGSIYQDAHPANANSKDKTRYDWKDGAFFQYDRAEHKYHVSVPSGGMVRLNVAEVFVQVQETEIEAKIQDTQISMTPSRLLLRVGAVKFEMTAAGITMTTPKFDANQI